MQTRAWQSKLQLLKGWGRACRSQDHTSHTVFEEAKEEGEEIEGKKVKEEEKRRRGEREGEGEEIDK